ncbi:hypothetical protein Dda_4574 [Drechslerella dactyloides]|uniref:Branched-chain-amino-acid aminotransferase n=1 Tax=Drechslerella dactyloides TaxID=74499 RepID=A0AAD6NKQ7_DREDA|nr:hypothetical protein Dda_4574 [Drechslerella dactyloides]
MAPAAVPVSLPTASTATALTNAGIKRDLANVAVSHKPQLDASKLTYEFNKNPKVVAAVDDPVRRLQNSTTDHMITAKWTEANGWEHPKLTPYGPFQLEPTASCLHYATEAFEGMKAYRGVDGKLRLFRPDLNAKRMNLSSVRIALPSIPPEEMETLIKEFIAIDGPKWLPDPNTFIYLRPAVIGSGAALGVQRPREATVFIIAALFPPLDKPTGMRLLASTEDMGVRAWHGGHGASKVGANYGPTLQAQGAAGARGFDQVLWLLGPEGRVTEAGASNFFVVWKNKTTGATQLVTAPLGDRIILDGVTRRSVLELARKHLAIGSTEPRAGGEDLEKVEVVEENFTITDMIEAYDEGRLLEAFACGTAFFIAPVNGVQYKDKEIEVPMPMVMPDGSRAGRYGGTIKVWLKEIMYGVVDHPWGVVINERGPVLPK